MFFQNLSKLLDRTDITLSVRGGEKQITVSVVPKSTNKEVDVQFPVMTISGSPEEVDQEFFNQINKPISDAVQFLVNKADLEKATSEKKQADAKKKEEAEKKKAAKEAAKKPDAKGAKAEPEPEEEQEEEAVDASQTSLF